MVLHQSNFEIPARFSFQPFLAEWRFASAETMEWVEEPPRLMAAMRADDVCEKNWLKVRIQGLNADSSGMLSGLGLGPYPSYEVLLDRNSIPPNVLQAHENYNNTPDISGRNFQVLICQKPEFKYGLFTLEPGTVKKNAWIMRDEFLTLDADTILGWEWSVRRFLNKWGLWEYDRGYIDPWNGTSLLNLKILHQIGSKRRIDEPDFAMVVPHLLQKQQEIYSKALLPNNARKWLRVHPLSLTTADEFPFFRVRRSYCCDAIEATITIDHLAERLFGICKRCHKIFQRETRHEKNYCSERCFNAAGVQRWREKQRKPAKKGTKRNAKG
jgi:hypothetical protein